jgi:hypothetical protein
VPTVTVSESRHRHPRIEVHRTTTLTAADWGRLARIPATSLARTLLDLATTEPARKLQQAIERAERLGALDLIAIDSLLKRRSGGSGTKRLREALELYRDPAFSRSRAELLFLDLVKKAGLPRPALNTFVAGYEIDAYWEMERFAVEVDGWDTHRTRAAFERDPVRQEELKLASIDSLRITARRIEREPGVIAERLSRLLAQRRQELASRARATGDEVVEDVAAAVLQQRGMALAVSTGLSPYERPRRRSEPPSPGERCAQREDRAPHTPRSVLEKGRGVQAYQCGRRAVGRPPDPRHGRPGGARRRSAPLASPAPPGSLSSGPSLNRARWTACGGMRAPWGRLGRDR